MAKHSSVRFAVAGIAAALMATQGLLAQDQTTTGSSGTTNMPDELKDLMPKDAAPPPATTSSSTAPSTTTTAPDIIDPKAALVQPAGASAPSKPSAAPATTTTKPEPPAPPAKAAPAKPAAPTVLLKGRLEEIGGSGAKLPVGVILNLKAQSAHMDPSVEKQLKGRVASFPTDWAGSFGGTINIWSSQFDPIAFEFDAEETQEEQAIESAGNKGQVTFNFSRQNNLISLQPATIVFPPRTNTPMARQMQSQLQNSPFGQLLGGNGGALLNSLTAATPIMYLGDVNATGVTGNAMHSVVVKNDIRELKQGVLEQDLLVQEQERHRQSGQVRRTYSETVLRFTRLNANQLYVQAATIKYRHDGHFESKVLMYGTVTRGQGTSNPMAMPGGFPAGAIPGLDSSGSAGLGDLNRMLKQLQGF